MKRAFCCIWLLWGSVSLSAQTAPSADTLSVEEAEAVAALLARNAAERATAPAPQQQQATAQETPKAVPGSATAQEVTEQEPSPAEKPACVTVAFIDIDVAFNEHPRTIAVKEQIREKILAKEQEVAQAKEEIEMRTRENTLLAALVREIKPFYERIVVEPQPLLPKIEEKADTLALENVLNRLTFAQAEVHSAGPLNTPAQLEDILARMAENKKVIAERNFFIDNYKYTTREEILKLEKQEVNEILQDIYREIKSNAQKRNISAIVRKDEILYGASPVNVTNDFVTRLKKSKKYRKRGK